MTWLWKGREVTPEDTEGSFGFVYLITNLSENKLYIGKKLLTKAKTRQVKGRKKKERVDSDWPTYYGSNKALLADVERLGSDNFKREILYFCKTRGECSYYEAKEQFARDVLNDPSYYNTWITCKIHRTHLSKTPSSSEKSSPIAPSSVRGTATSRRRTGSTSRKS